MNASLLSGAALLLLGALGAAGLFWLLQRRAARPGDGEHLALTQLQQQVSDLIRTLHETRHQITRETGDQLSVGTKALTDLVQASQTQVTGQMVSQSKEVGDRVGALQERLVRLGDEIRHLAEMGADLRKLQDILRAPKVRGNLGEQLLENLLGNMLPPTDYRIQHAFAGGEKVDAAIRLPGGLVPVDAKFPLENFQKLLSSRGEDESRRARKAFTDDIRRHARAIASRYIRPQEGTLDLALMYVPAESVYYEAFVHGERGEEVEALWAEVLGLRVFPVSPNTFSLYLSTLQLGLRGFRIEEGARRIVATLATLQGDFRATRESFDLMSKHFLNAARNLDEVRKRLESFDWKLSRVDAPDAPDTVTAIPNPGPALARPHGRDMEEPWS